MSDYISPSITRERMRNTGVCDACTHEEAAGTFANELLLQLDFRESVVTLCVVHEKWLLTTLLGNYIKRRSKGKPADYLLRITETVKAATEVDL